MHVPLVIRRSRVRSPPDPAALFLEIFSTVILSLPLSQEGQLSVSGERMLCLNEINVSGYTIAQVLAKPAHEKCGYVNRPARHDLNNVHCAVKIYFNPTMLNRILGIK